MGRSSSPGSFGQKRTNQKKFPLSPVNHPQPQLPTRGEGASQRTGNEIEIEGWSFEKLPCGKKNPQQWPQSMNNLQFVFAHVCTLNSILDKETHIGCIIAAKDFEIQHLLQQLHVVNSQVENSQQAAADLRDELDFRGKELLEAIMLKRCGKNTKRYEEFALNMRVFLLNCDTLEGRFVRRTMFAYSESVVESCR